MTPHQLVRPEDHQPPGRLPNREPATTRPQVAHEPDDGLLRVDGRDAFWRHAGRRLCHIASRTVAGRPLSAPLQRKAKACTGADGPCTCPQGMSRASTVVDAHDPPTNTMRGATCS